MCFESLIQINFSYLLQRTLFFFIVKFYIEHLIFVSLNCSIFQIMLRKEHW